MRALWRHFGCYDTNIRGSMCCKHGLYIIFIYSLWFQEPNFADSLCYQQILNVNMSAKLEHLLWPFLWMKGRLKHVGREDRTVGLCGFMRSCEWGFRTFSINFCTCRMWRLVFVVFVPPLLHCDWTVKKWQWRAQRFTQSWTFFNSRRPGKNGKRGALSALSRCCCCVWSIV